MTDYLKYQNSENVHLSHPTLESFVIQIIMIEQFV